MHEEKLRASHFTHCGRRKIFTKLAVRQGENGEFFFISRDIIPFFLRRVKSFCRLSKKYFCRPKNLTVIFFWNSLLPDRISAQSHDILTKQMNRVKMLLYAFLEPNNRRRIKCPERIRYQDLCARQWHFSCCLRQYPEWERKTRPEDRIFPIQCPPRRISHQQKALSKTT